MKTENTFCFIYEHPPMSSFKKKAAILQRLRFSIDRFKINTLSCVSFLPLMVVIL